MVRSVFLLVMLLVLRAFCKWFVSRSVVSFIVAATDLPYLEFIRRPSWVFPYIIVSC